MSEKSDGFGIAFLWAFWLFVAGMVFWVIWVGDINVAWYSLRYGVSAGKVHVEAKPRDCDFLTAPLGTKGCHYDASADAFNAAGFLVGGDRVPMYVRDPTGKISLSLKDKTRELVPMPNISDFPNRKVDSVYVSWVKVPD